MNDNQIIIEHFEGYKEYPLKVVKIEPLAEEDGNYYNVTLKNDKGVYVSMVLVQNDRLIVVPR